MTNTRAWMSLLVPFHIWLTYINPVDAASQRSALDSNMFEDEAFDVLGGVEDAEDLTRKLLSEEDRNFQRDLVGAMCEGPTGIHYFEVFIRFEPSGELGAWCDVADQIFLGNDLNQLLLDYGIGDAGTSDEAIFLAGVCTQPSIDRRRRQLQSLSDELRIFNLVWNGGGGCRGFCSKDDGDRRGLRALQTGDWFTDTFAPQMSATLEAAILDTVVPNHANCLGLNPGIKVEMVEVSLQDLNLKCDTDGKVIESLESLHLGDLPLKRTSCDQCVSLDFSEDAEGNKLLKGEYIKTQFSYRDGLTITASGGYTPWEKARVFDTGDAICVNADGSQEFGSPNKQCEGGGLGVGAGGESGKLGENCKPVGNVLIVQESRKDCPDSDPNGGMITFEWEKPVLVSDIGLMDVDEDGQRIRFYYADGFFETFAYQGFGDNAVQRVVAGKRNVVKVEVIFPGTGAITEINFCPVCRPLLSHDLEHHCIFTQDGTSIKSQEVVYYENFENAGSETKWMNGRAEQSVVFTRHMGRYFMGASSPYKMFMVDMQAAGIVFDLDFYEIDSWDDKKDRAVVYVDGEACDLGEFSYRKDEGHRSGTTPLGIVWTLDSIDLPGQYGGDSKLKDQRHRVKITVPRTTGLYRDEELRLTLGALQAKEATTRASAGWDNIKATVIHECH